MVTSELRESYRYMREHAGYVVGQRAAGALALARAEIIARNLGWETVWRADDDAELGDHEMWCAGARRDAAGYDADGERISRWSRQQECPGHFAEWAALRDESGECLESLGGVLDADRAYTRVVEAEMALSALHTRGVDDLARCPALYQCV